jgi:hypothetical protein
VTQTPSKSELSASSRLAIYTEDSVLFPGMSDITIQLSFNVVETASLRNFIKDYGDNE